MLVMPTRFVLLIIDGIFLTTVVQLLTIGHSFKSGPIPNGCRKKLIHFMYHVCCSFFLVVAAVRTSVTSKEFDYSYYLGDHYKENQKKVQNTSTIVSNHVSWLDPVILIKNIRPAFAPSAEFKNVPLLGTLIECIDSIYIPRGGSEESKAKALAAIRGRQELIEETGKYAPFLIFAEGGTTNGSGLIKYKKGAFFAEKTVRPIYMKYKFGSVNPAFDTIEYLPLAILTLSWAGYSCDLSIMPDFTPNDYLFENHADKGSERWEVYAWAVRDAMMKSGGFGECNIPLRTKLLYESYMQRHPGAAEPPIIDPENKLLTGANLLSPLTQPLTKTDPSPQESMERIEMEDYSLKKKLDPRVGDECSVGGEVEDLEKGN
eukprot:CAMPEP_0170493354 /NCGR_PEP_ID=MMETSP0208-20121228/13746_1 /TAXON_ID=197538 /ORGANISM="Strombidium inclinatum, Strain S3" /LENGTH=373 /DNA_ID=CAMNT_0010769273 /DNA_START=276 /DNA_END=1397 /DNA_ORIENTATION=+